MKLRYLLVFSLACIFFSGCGDDDYDVDSQYDAFLRYLENRNLTEDPRRYTEIDGVMFRYTYDEHDPIGKIGEALTGAAEMLALQVSRLVETPENYLDNPALLRSMGTTVWNQGYLIDSMGRTLAENFPDIVIDNDPSGLSRDGMEIQQFGLELAAIAETIRVHTDEDEGKEGEETGENGMTENPSDEFSEKEVLARFWEIAVRLDELIVPIHALGTELSEKGQTLDTDFQPQTVKTGDKILAYYTGYLFSSSGSATSYGRGTVFTSNHPEVVVQLGMEDWPTDLLEMTVGSGDNLRGFNIGLPGTKELDVTLLYLTADLAYGNKIIGIVPKGSPVVFEFSIEKVIKK